MSCIVVLSTLLAIGIIHSSMCRTSIFSRSLLKRDEAAGKPPISDMKNIEVKEDLQATGFYRSIDTKKKWSEEEIFSTDFAWHGNGNESIRHYGTQWPLPVSPYVEQTLSHVASRSLYRPTPDAIRSSVYVVACDKTHYDLMKDAVASYQFHYPGRKMILYDLGLTKEQVGQIKKWCNLEYRVFDFSLYPPFVKNLKTYSWKVFVTLDVLKQHDAMIWMDSTIRVDCPELIEQVALTAGNSGVIFPRIGVSSIFSHTHPSMYYYIATNLTQAQIMPMRGGSFFGIINTKEMFDSFIKWWVRCAFNEACMAGGPLHCLSETKYYKRFANCHRYDQSAADLLLLHHYKGDVGPYSTDPCVDVQRKVSHDYDLSFC